VTEKPCVVPGVAAGWLTLLVAGPRIKGEGNGPLRVSYVIHGVRERARARSPFARSRVHMWRACVLRVPSPSSPSLSPLLSSSRRICTRACMCRAPERYACA